MRLFSLLLLACPLAAQPALGDVPGTLATARAKAKETAGPAPAPANPWTDAAPTLTPAEAIGGYAEGCLRGAQMLELSGPGFEVMKPSRRKFYGHPRMLSFIRRLGKAAADQGVGKVLVGNIGMGRGGPSSSGHLSHQNGLDVDLRYTVAPLSKKFSAAERESFDSPEVVQREHGRLLKSWDPKAMDVLRLAASDPEVHRILVNPSIKREACRLYKGAEWLRTLRPWWMHDDHFHLRLRCPESDKACKAQEEVPQGDGCVEELNGWLTPAAREKARKLRLEPPTARDPYKVPQACLDLLKE